MTETLNTVSSAGFSETDPLGRWLLGRAHAMAKQDGTAR